MRERTGASAPTVLSTSGYGTPYARMGRMSQVQDPVTLPQRSEAVAPLPEVVGARLERMVEELAALVSIESPSNSPEGLRACADYLSTLGTTLLGRRPERRRTEAIEHLLWRFGARPRILLVGHFDTVHPIGTLEVFPFSDDGTTITGPGVCDMKGGLIVLLHAVSVLVERHGADALDGLWIFLNADEEVASERSMPILEELARDATVALVFENGGADGELKVERRGRSDYELRFTGRAVHAGMRPQDGINAITELVRQYDRVVAIGDPAVGTSVTPTLASAGSTFNTVPEHASLRIDVRCARPEEQVRVDHEMRSLRPVQEGASIDVVGGIQMHPMSSESSAALWQLAQDVADVVGQHGISAMAVGGTSNACDLARLGLQVIDGLGTVGEDDHTLTEWMAKESLVSRTVLAAGMAAALLGLPVDGKLVPTPLAVATVG